MKTNSGLIVEQGWSGRPTGGAWRGQALALAALMTWLPLRRAEAEERLDFKTLYYKEDGDRMKVFAPSAMLEHELTPTLMIRLEGIYNSISGATPTGAPPRPAAAAKAVTTAPTASSPSGSTGSSRPGSGTTAAAPAPVVSPVVTAPVHHDDDVEAEGNDRRLVRVGGTSGIRALPLNRWAKAGATPAPAPAPSTAPAPVSAPTVTTSPSAPSSSTTTAAPSAPASSTPGAPAAAAAPAATPAAANASSKNQPVPRANSSDQRYGLVLELIKTWERHTVAAQFAYSTESDYVSKGLALRDAIDFNQKNTTLLLGVSANHDLVQGYYQPDTTTKNSYDGMIGVTQLLDPKTFITVNLTLGQSSGYLTDPYKVVELNGTLIPEKRPDSRNKQVVYLALNRFIEPAEASAEVSYRYYHDSFGIMAHTLTFAWYQKLGEHFILRPMVRYYQQGAANFYAERFADAPEYYSADYRLSELSALGYGLKLIWKPAQRLSFDVDFERYEQQGRDGVTSQDAYPAATILMVGATLWF